MFPRGIAPERLPGEDETNMEEWMRRLGRFVRQETVLCVALGLGAVSCLAVPPDAGYADYVDWDTLAMLFSLMAVMRGFQDAGLFEWLGGRLLRRAANTRQMLLSLVFFPFFLSMVVTNDVSLLTFVPFGLVVLGMAGQTRLAVPLVALQTLAANLGSMLTPMGNPQNLYLYGRAGVGFAAFCSWMLPYVALSGLCIAVLCMAQPAAPLANLALNTPLRRPQNLPLCTAGFALCLLGVFGVLPPVGLAAAVFTCLLLVDRSLLARLDYSLLLTFIGFFVFIGNIGRIEAFRAALSALLAKAVVPVAVLASQVTSNVPAALLLAGFTDQWQALVIGCNLGGLGTLIASMASLISYKLIVAALPEVRGRYFRWFTASNIGMLALLLAAWAGLTRA